MKIIYYCYDGGIPSALAAKCHLLDKYHVKDFYNDIDLLLKKEPDLHLWGKSEGNEVYSMGAKTSSNIIVRGALGLLDILIEEREEIIFIDVRKTMNLLVYIGKFFYAKGCKRLAKLIIGFGVYLSWQKIKKIVTDIKEKINR